MNHDCFDDFWYIAIVEDELRPWPITLFDMSPTVDSNFLSSSMIQFRKCAANGYSYSAGAEQYGKYLPIGYWDSDWLLWDLSKPLEQVDEAPGRWLLLLMTESGTKNTGRKVAAHVFRTLRPCWSGAFAVLWKRNLRRITG